MKIRSVFLGIRNEVTGLKLFVKRLFKKTFPLWLKKPGSTSVTNSPVTASNYKSHPLSSSFLRELSCKYEGKLLLRKEITVNEEVFQRLLSNHLFTSLPSLQKKFFSLICKRCNNKKQSLFAKIPCLRCNETHYYCRKCIAMGRIMECEPLYYWTGEGYDWPRVSQPCSWKGTLSPPQKRAANKIKNVVIKGGKLLVWAVTGAGKTEMLYPGITVALQKGKRVCIATPRKDVVRELLPRLQQAFTSIHIQGLYSGSRDNDGTAQLIISTTHQLFRYFNAFDVLIIDEIDAFPFHQDTTLHFAASRAVKKMASLIYLTATPSEKLQSDIAFKKLDHVFVPVRFHGHPLPVPKTIRCSTHKRTDGQVILPPQFKNWFKKRRVPSRQLLIFVPTIQLAEKLKQPITQLLLRNKWITTRFQIESVHAEDRKREQKIERFRNKQIRALVTTTILERGVTFPEIDVVVLRADHSIFDEAALIQIAGRAGRSSIDPVGEIVFFHDGKTHAMVHAKQQIIKMNQRARKLNHKAQQ